MHIPEVQSERCTQNYSDPHCIAIIIYMLIYNHCACNTDWLACAWAEFKAACINDVTKIWTIFYLPPSVTHLCFRPYALLSWNVLLTLPLCVTSFKNDPWCQSILGLGRYEATLIMFYLSVFTLNLTLKGLSFQPELCVGMAPCYYKGASTQYT